MALDPNIALGVRPMELANPLAQYAQVSQIQNAQNQNQLAQYQLATAQREQESVNALNKAYAAAYDTKTGQIDANALRKSLAGGGFGSKLPAVEKGLLELGKLKTETQSAEIKLLEDKLKQSRGLLEGVSTPEQYIAWHEANHKDPIIGPALAARGITAEQSRARIMDAITKGPTEFQRLINESKLGTEKFMELNKPTTSVVNRSGQSDIVQTPGLGGTPVTAGTYADVPLPPAVVAQKKDIARAGASSVNLPPQEKAEQGDRGKLLVKQYEGISETARIGARTLPSLESNAAILDKGFDTGFGTEAKAAGAKVLGALGVKDAQNYATSAQTFLGNASSAILQKQLEQKGPQTESDAQRITQTGAQLGNTKEANKFFIDVAKEQIKRDVDQRNFYDKWWEQKKTYDGAENAWYSGEGGKSLFERPGLKKYINPTSNASQIPGQGPAAPAARNTAPAANVITNPQFPGFSIGKP